jgi:TPP-dependent pyruvate/acetoin dehydrogenase alpha subunit
MEGRDGNIHLGAFDRGTIPMISHLPEMLPVGMGVAMSRRRRGLDSVALGFCGDGASCGGVFHETLNLAAVWRVPLVLILERNRYAYMTPESRYLPIDQLSQRAAGYGMSSWTADGNDVVEVHQVVSTAIANCRSDGAPALVEVFTFRMHGHGAHDGQKCVPAEELQRWEEQDPLRRWREHARIHLDWSDQQQQALERRVSGEIEAALADALAADYPPVDGLGQSVYA